MNKLKKIKKAVQTVSSFTFVFGVKLALASFAIGIVADI